MTNISIHSLDGYRSLVDILFITLKSEATVSSAVAEKFQGIRVSLLCALLFHSLCGILKSYICFWCSGEQIYIGMMLLKISDFHLLGSFFVL